MKRGLGIEEGLAGGAIGEDEDDKEHEEAQELGQHPVHDDHLGPDVPPDMEQSQEPEVENQIVGGKHNPSK